MKSVMSSSALGRRVVPGLVVALSAATMSLGLAGPASALTTIDLEGIVHGVGGVPVQDACVDAYDASDGSYIDEYCTAADGHYEFDSLTASSVKIFTYDDSSFAYTGDTQYLERWYGSKFKANATPIGITVDGDKVQDLTMTPAATISGTVAAVDGHALTGSYWPDVVNSDFDYPDFNLARDGINFKLAIEPGTYRIGASGYDDPLVGDNIFYLEKWWTDSDTMVSATPVTVPAAGVGGINLRLTSSLTARQAPQIDGFAAVGRPLTATSGTWSRNAGTEFSYTWKRGATVVGTGATYTPTVADLNQPLNVVVRALNGTNAGEAASAQTDPVRYPSDARGRAGALSGHKVRFAVKIVSAKQSPVKGKVVVLRGTKVVHKAVKLIGGKAVIIVKGQPKGRQTFTVLYKGNSLLSKASKSFTVRVR
jgi:hypothetical protein